MFFALGTQWRWHPMLGLRTGIDYGAIASTASGLKLDFGPSVFADIRAMEAAALDAWSK